MILSTSMEVIILVVKIALSYKNLFYSLLIPTKIFGSIWSNVYGKMYTPNF